MKKLIVSLLSLIVVMCSSAQSYDMGVRHHISISVSDNLPLTKRSIISSGVIGHLMQVPNGYRLGDTRSKGSYALGYTYTVSPLIGVGMDLGYEGSEIDLKLYNMDYVAITRKADLYMAMATVEVRYYQNEWVRIHGRAGLGALSDFKGDTSLAFQLDALDFRFGSDRIAGFLRTGFGIRGFFTLGLQVGL